MRYDDRKGRSTKIDWANNQTFKERTSALADVHLVERSRNISFHISAAYRLCSAPFRDLGKGLVVDNGISLSVEKLLRNGLKKRWIYSLCTLFKVRSLPASVQWWGIYPAVATECVCWRSRSNSSTTMSWTFVEKTWRLDRENVLRHSKRRVFTKRWIIHGDIVRFLSGVNAWGASRLAQVLVNFKWNGVDDKVRETHLSRKYIHFNEPG